MFFKKYGDIVVGVFFMVLIRMPYRNGTDASEIQGYGDWTGFHADGNWCCYLYPGSNPHIFKH